MRENVFREVWKGGNTLGHCSLWVRRWIEEDEDGRGDLGFIHHIRLFLLPFHVFSYLYGCFFPIDGLIFVF